MGLIARILSFTRVERNGAKTNDVKTDTGANANITSEHFSSPGDDSNPLPQDYCINVGVTGSGRQATIGYVDTLNGPKALTGDKRIYARDASGVLIVELWLKNTGEAALFNDNGSVTLKPNGSIEGTNGLGVFELQTNGDFVVNGVTIAANGSVTIPNSLTLDGKEIAGHTHSQADDSGGNTEQDTGVNQ